MNRNEKRDGHLKIMIGIASHKSYWIPKNNIYYPILVGKKEHNISGWNRDNTGENISAKNDTYCELTALYWMWKNLDADIYGLVHYRRYFANRKYWQKKKQRIITASEIEGAMDHANIVLPVKRHYWLETNASQYCHAHNEADLLQMKAILSQKHPHYLQAWDAVMARRSGHRFNMFLMKKEPFHAYCHWLFDILSALEDEMSATKSITPRIFGFMSERLLDVWLEEKKMPYLEFPVVHLESQHWPKKIYLFLKRKIGQGTA